VSDQRARARKEFRRMMKWIVLAAILMVIGGLFYSSLFTELTTHLVIAVVLGTFFSVLLGTGLFALAFFSDKSGHDDNVTDATKRRDRR
jgi:uncharacterized membrane protein HdeD (DUF308 family)